MEVSTVHQKVISRVFIDLSEEEAWQLKALLAPLPSTGIVYPLYRELSRALREAN